MFPNTPMREENTANPYVVDSWYLTEIDDPLTGRQILFSYAERNISSVGESTISYYKENDYSIITRRYSVNVVQDLVGISCADQYLVNFQYQPTQRFDLSGEYALSSVSVQSPQFSNRYLSKYDLTTSYFILNRYGIPSSDFQKQAARLCLLSVKKYSADLKADDQPYMFDYYLGSDITDDFVPPPFFPVKDIWGFYNGLNSTAYDNSTLVSKPLSQLTIADLNDNDCKGLCFLKNNVTGVVLNAKSSYAKNGLLKQIVYPTGGTLTYTYIQNSGKFESETTTNTVGGIHVSQTSSTDGGYSNGCSNPLITSYNYVLDASGTPSIWGIERPRNVKLDANGNPVPIQNHYHPETPKYKYSFPFGPSGIALYQYPEHPFYSKDASSLTWHQQFIMIMSQILNAVSIVSEIEDVVTLILGPTPMGWVAVIMDIIGGLYTFFKTLWTNPSKDYPATVYYNSDLNSANPLPAQFRRVEVVPNTGDVGKTIETFTNPYDDNISQQYALWLPDNPNFLMEQRYAYWAYGLPRIITTYDVSGYKVKEVENIYDFSTAQEEFIDDKIAPSQNHPITSCDCEVVKSTSQKSPDWTNPAIYNDPSTSFFVIQDGSNYLLTSDLNLFRYNMYTGEALLDTTYERTYKPASSTCLTTITTYQYGHPTSNYLDASALSEISTTQSNGNIKNKYIKYSGDYQYSGGIFQTMGNNNIYYFPVESNTTVNNGTSELTLNEQVSEYAQVTGGALKPSRILEQRFSSPQSSPYEYNGANTVYSNYKQIQTFTYDASANLTGIQDEGSHTVTNIYDYSNRFVTASVINADPVADKPDYTSFETSGFGGWSLTGTASYNTTKAITGTRSFNLSTGLSLKASGLNTLKPYKLTFWATSSGATITTTGGSASLSFSGPAYNGFTYYEYNIAQGASAVTVAGTTTIDELRLYPKNSRMLSTTYDPLIGKTAECDENNRITYYEYDDQARLRFIKDENNNIVKMYEYNVVSNKQGGCPGSYSNHLIIETFTRNNCSAGYQGSIVAYTVPAGKYTSAKSQADADQQAENDINTNGQAAANSSGSSSCSIIYYNHGKSQTFTTDTCTVSQAAGTVTYTVPANKYSSTVSQAAVDSMEQDEINANSQALANRTGYRACTNTNAPNWRADSNASTRCQTDVNYQHTGHVEVLMKDVNPGSSTYNQTSWKDVGFIGSTCPNDNPYYPCLSTTGTSTKTGSNVLAYPPGSIVTVTVTLNSSDPAATLSGNISESGGGTVSLSGSGNHSQVFTVTVGEEGYIIWSLSLHGTGGTGTYYICSNIQFQ